MKISNFGERVYEASVYHELYDERQVAGKTFYKETGLLQTAVRLAICVNGVRAWRKAGEIIEEKMKPIDVATESALPEQTESSADLEQPSPEPAKAVVGL